MARQKTDPLVSCVSLIGCRRDLYRFMKSLLVVFCTFSIALTGCPAGDLVDGVSIIFYSIVIVVALMGQSYNCS